MLSAVRSRQFTAQQIYHRTSTVAVLTESVQKGTKTKKQHEISKMKNSLVRQANPSNCIITAVSNHMTNFGRHVDGSLLT